MYITDVYPDKKSYDEPFEMSEEQELRRIDSEKNSLRQLESGDIYGAVGLAFSLLWYKERREEAFKYCEMMLAAPPSGNTHCIAYYVLAGLHIPNGEYDQAIALLQKGREIEPFDGFLCRGLFYIYYHLKEYDKALEIILPEYEAIYNEIYGDEPQLHDPNFCEMIGLTYCMKGDYEEGKRWFILAFEEPFDDKWQAEMHYRIGQCWQNLGDEYRARASYKTSLELDPGLPEVYNNLASLAFNEHGHVQEAIQLLEIALQRLQESEDEYQDLSVTIWRNLKLLYHTIADYEKETYAKYKILCSMGVGMLFQDPSQPSEDSDEEEDEMDYDEDTMMDDEDEEILESI